MSRFFVPPEAVKGSSIVIGGKEAHHILDVMRLKVSDTVVTFDGTGKEYKGVIREVSRNSLTVEIKDVRIPAGGESGRITLLQAMPKKEKMDYIVEKATELGVHAIAPVITARTIPDWSESKKKAQSERWAKIAREAAKQCSRLDIPSISPISDFADSIKAYADFDMKMIAVLNDETVSVKSAMAGFTTGKIAIAIGPEGDFTSEEVSMAKDCGFKPVSLGSRVLKSDTAGLALLAILNYELSN